MEEAWAKLDIDLASTTAYLRDAHEKAQNTGAVALSTTIRQEIDRIVIARAEIGEIRRMGKYEQASIENYQQLKKSARAFYDTVIAQLSK